MVSEWLAWVTHSLIPRMAEYVISWKEHGTLSSPIPHFTKVKVRTRPPLASHTVSSEATILTQGAALVCHTAQFQPPSSGPNSGNFQCSLASDSRAQTLLSSLGSRCFLSRHQSKKKASSFYLPTILPSEMGKDTEYKGGRKPHHAQDVFPAVSCDTQKSRTWCPEVPPPGAQRLFQHDGHRGSWVWAPCTVRGPWLGEAAGPTWEGSVWWEPGGKTDAALNSADAVREKGQGSHWLSGHRLVGILLSPLACPRPEAGHSPLLNASFPVSGNAVSPTHLAAAKANCSHVYERP